MARILLFGKDGQLGHGLGQAEWFRDRGLALGKSDCDLGDEGAIRQSVRDAAPEIIINAAAYTAVDRAEDEPEPALAINGRAPEILAEEARAIGAVLIHYSTDYVFDGSKSGAYVETDPVGPVGVYGDTKLAGEKAIAASGCRHVILRTSWVYSAHGENFARTMLRLGREREALCVVADQWGTPTSVDLLTDVTGRIVERLLDDPEPANPIFGLFHCAAAGRTNWRDYAAFFLSCCAEAGLDLKVDPEAIAAIPSDAYPTKARRPQNSLLSSAKLEQTLGLTMPDWRIGVRDLAIELANDLVKAK